MTSPDALARAREAYRRSAWREAYDGLAAADRRASLGAEDLELLAAAAYLSGRDSDVAALWARAHQAFLERGNVERAARCAFWLAVGLLERGEVAPGGGWIARARRMLDESRRDCVECGYLLLPDAMRHFAEGDNAAACEAFARAADTGARFGDGDLAALARHGQGRALIRLGRIAEGLALLDEAMVAVTSGELSPMVAGDVYCSVLSACHEIYDLRRAREWTEALSRWCAAQPELVPYRGQCLVRRAEVLQLHGDWPDAMEDALRASNQLARSLGRSAAGAAYYQQAELHRLRGDFTAAEAAYRLAAEAGRSAQPGLALLRLAQGQTAGAAAAIDRALHESRDRRSRSRLLPAAVEILLAAGDRAAARAAAGELADIAAGVGAPWLRAVAGHADGAVRLADGDAQGALAALREAFDLWCELDAPYDAARTRVLLARACGALGDRDAMELETAAARRTFGELGAAPDLERAEPAAATAPPPTGGLTPRELEVLRLVATGRTNRAIADELGISEKTVARHVSNIFTRLGISSRSAATAYAYEHRLV